MKKYVFFLFSLSFLILACQAQKSNIFSTKQGAIRGYDPVAYFLAGEATKGSKEFSLDWQGATWYFSTAKNKALFQENPTAYAPQYGGYCAYAVSNGYTASIDPESWKIFDDKLYLNYSPKIQKTWEADVPGYIQKADAQWPKVLKKN